MKKIVARVDARRAVGWACAAGALTTLLLGASFWWARHRAVSAARDRARGEAARAARVIDAEARRFQSVVQAAADDLDAGRVDRRSLDARLKSAVDATPQMSGIGAAFRPLAYDPNLRLYAPYYRRKGESVELLQLDSLYDYTLGHEWYSAALDGRPSWSEPEVAAAEGKAVVEYAAPFRLGGRGPSSGVIHGTMSLSEIDGLVSSLDLGEFGYGFLVSKGGFLISHPFAEKYAAAGRPSLLSKGELDPVTGEPCWIFSEPVPSTGWTVGVVFFKEMSSTNRLLRRQEIRFAISLIVTLCLFIAFVLEPHRREHDVAVLWAGSVLGSLVLGLGIAWLWSIGYARPPASSNAALVDRASVRRFVLDSTRRSLKSTGRLPVIVPTGVFLQTLEILGPNNVAITGYIWQKYSKSAPKDLARGFVLPDAADRTITEEYRRVEGDSEVIGWFVKAVVRQDFDYSGYPLDQQDFKLRIQHADLDGRVVLVPDLDSYPIIHPLSRAGLASGFVLPGWTVERTQFGSGARERTTSFGVASGRQSAGNELSFDVLIDRRILEPVFSSLLPLAVCAFMVFSLMLMIKESTRVNIIQTLAAYSALIFVAILSQLDLRRRVSGTNILYIEYFYFATYGAMLVSALVTLTNGWPGHVPWIEQREHFYPKLLFWPVMMSVLAVITICAFY